jgi:Uma2 family endonuclease
MATVAQKLITAEQFIQMPDPPDGSEQELVRGEVITMPPPGGLHGVCCSKTDRRLGNFVEANKLGTVTANDAGIITERDPDTVRGPDVAYWSFERLPEVPAGYIETPPDLAVEVLSPWTKMRQLGIKIQEFFRRGVRMVWVIDPEDRTVTVYRIPDEGRLFHETATLSGEDVLPGFSCRVADLLP